ncbi:MAG: glucosidase, partial [Planctomycetaceae bacterium]|nr:glucosidase [Planctomycetaceae bacterium]
MPPFPLRSAEIRRLAAESRRSEDANWKRWGTYLAERQWGTVREDYSLDGEPWNHFTHDNAVWRAYRWGEDGILGWTDRQNRLCFAITLWNGKDPILKERLFGLSGPEGNHGEDVKECYYYLDALPTHSYCHGLYKYPQQEFPYRQLIEENSRRNRDEREYELIDTSVFDDNKYFDVHVEYAKAAPEDTLIRVTICNRGNDSARLHLLPTFWFRNFWDSNTTFEADHAKPSLALQPDGGLLAEDATLGRYRIYADIGPKGYRAPWWFTENETNSGRLRSPQVNLPGCKDAFHLYLIKGMKDALNATPEGTKSAAYYILSVPARSQITIRLRLCREDLAPDVPFGSSFEDTFDLRKQEADAFYDLKVDAGLTIDERRVLRQANAGLFWTKQFYYYSVNDWLNHGPERPIFDKINHLPRNGDWGHLFNRDVISMPDKWEYPWYAAWDSAFHMIPFAHLDINYAKEQMIMFLREWYMHP